MKNLYHLIVLLLVLFIAGCAASGPMYTSDAGATLEKGNLVVYRPYRFLSGGAYANVYIDDQKVGVLKNGGYLRLDVGSGTHALKVGTQSRMISASNNEKLFFRYSHRWMFLFVEFVSATLNDVNEKAAFDELKDTKLSA